MKEIFKITVEVTRQEETLTGRTWEANAYSEGEDKRPDGYGYTPQVIEVKNVERVIYTQTLENLDIPGLIAQVNKAN